MGGILPPWTTAPSWTSRLPTCHRSRLRRRPKGRSRARCRSPARERARFHRSPTTAFYPTARRWRWWRPAAASSGCACRGSTRPAYSVRCSTVTRDTSGSAPRDRGAGRRGATSRGPWCSRRAGGTKAGWIIVRDALLIGGWHHERRALPHPSRRAPTDYDADHVLLRTARCVNGEVEVLLECEPVFDYGRKPGRWEYTDGGYHEGMARARGGRCLAAAATDLRLGFRGRTRDRPHTG